MNHRHARILLVAALAAAAAATALGAHAQDRTEVERTRIVGNRELPKVLTVVPWKKPLPGQLFGHPLPSLLDAPPQPLAPTEFRRRTQAATPTAQDHGETR
ncbi:MAG: hypothetical protein KGL18_17780 [Burkholderiales bacterium]|nr:hypothetical protein [Burkholderiales bacterium]MDE1929841.1 hypothetical protein [Burkholderiales bacterium]MDE2161189.1 hypothetical protein [Burkholderiales bacterium]MDE2504817.1 hypothetical protein [Burkholderiales bacterium]